MMEVSPDERSLYRLPSAQLVSPLSDKSQYQYSSQPIPHNETHQQQPSQAPLLSSLSGEDQEKEQELRATQRWRLFSPDGWLWELSNLALATAAFVALIIVLYKYENRPSPNWPSGISLNTIISIVSTIFRAALSLSVTRGIGQLVWIRLADKTGSLDDICWYDSASRGPLGSLLLLWKLKFM
jgi:hypothetical protein